MNIYSDLKDRMISIYGDFYFSAFKKNPGGTEKYAVAKSIVARMIMVRLYEAYVSSGECVPLEDLKPERKELYWNLALDYFKVTEERSAADLKMTRINASKTMYIMDLITNNFSDGK